MEPDSGDDVFTGGRLSRSSSQKNLHSELQPCPRLEARDPSAPWLESESIPDTCYLHFALVLQVFPVMPLYNAHGHTEHIAAGTAIA